MTDVNPAYLTKYLCRACRKTFKRPVAGKGERVCPHCSGQAIRMGHKFRPPKQSDEAAWKMVEFLVSKGFYFDSLWVHSSGPGAGARTLVTYPTSLKEAADFVEKYAEYAVPLDENTGRIYDTSR